MKILINSDVCQGHGRCTILAPGLIVMDEQGFPSGRGAAIEVPPGMETVAEEIEGSCPELAISLLP